MNVVRHNDKCVELVTPQVLSIANCLHNHRRNLRLAKV